MKLRALHVKALPGIEEGFSLPRLGDAINVLTGPNASGKSSVVRAVRALLYRHESKGEPVHLEGTFAYGDGEFVVQRIGDTILWTRNGTRCDPPPLPEPHQLGGYMLRVEDLVRRDEKGDEAIAKRIATALAGGFDLAAARMPHALKSTHGRDENDAFRNARQARLATRTALAELADEEARQGELETARKQAAQLAATTTAVHNARRLLSEQGRGRELDLRLKDFPEAMTRLKGNEVEWLDSALADLETARNDLRTAREKAEAGRRRFASTGLPEDEPSRVEVQERLRQAEQLRLREEEHAKAAKDVAEIAAGLRSLLSGAGEDGDGGSAEHAPAAIDLTPETIAEITEMLEKRQEAVAEAEDLDRRIRRARAEAPEEVPDPEPLHLPKRLLADWLAAPVPDAVPAWRRSGAWAFALATLAAGGAAAAVDGGSRALVAPLPGLLLLLSVVLFMTGLVLSRPRPQAGAERRGAAQREYGACDAEAPRSWSTGGVRERYEDLTRRATWAEVAAERKERARERVRELELEHDAASAAAGEAHQAFEQACAAAGLPAAEVDVRLTARLRWLHEVRLQRKKLEERRADHRRLGDEVAADRADLTGMLARTGDAPEGNVGAGRIKVRLDDLILRIHEREAAREAIALAGEAERKAKQAIREVEVKLRELFRSCGIALPDAASDAEAASAGAELRERMGRHHEWRDLQRQRREVEVTIRNLEHQLAAHPDLRELAAAGDDASLEQREKEAERAGERRDQLLGRIAETGERLRNARRARKLEKAQAEETKAKDALEARLDEALTAEAGRFLLDRVEKEHRHEQEPAALRLARRWFGRFTHHAHSLEFDAARPGPERLYARDTAAGRDRSLEELSTGTRAQLLLAVRVAHAIDNERGRTPLPLFLDEALTTTDAERFETVAEALCTLAREDGRQVFYLSARRADAALWQALAERVAPTADGLLRTIDVAAVRRLPWSASAAGAYEPVPPPQLPDPETMGPEDFAAALGVAPIDPWAPDAVHPFHLLRDRLPLVVDLARLRIDSSGAARAFVGDAGRASELVGEGDLRVLRARLDAAESWCRAWRSGRARPLSEAALVACDAITERFRPDIVELAAQLGGDAEALLEELQARSVTGFGRTKIDSLRAWLEERGHLPDEIAGPAVDAVVALASALRDHDLPDVAAEAERLARWWEAGVSRGVRDAAAAD